jgi:hypothetical protein
MKQTLTILIVASLFSSSCERDSSKSVMDSFPIPQSTQASSEVKVAVTAEQMKASEAQMASQPIATSSRETTDTIPITKEPEIVLSPINTQSGDVPKGWAIFSSSAIKNQTVWETDNWDDFGVIDTPPPSFSFIYPALWSFDGVMQFYISNIGPSDKSGKGTTAEFVPGIVRLKPNQQCFDNKTFEDNGVKLSISMQPIRIGSLHGSKIVMKSIDSTGEIFKNISYCISEGHRAILIAFFATRPDSSTEKKFDNVVSSFRFIDAMDERRKENINTK